MCADYIATHKISRVDLIALDSPFIAEPPAAASSTQPEADFKALWDGLAKANMRGWCESPVEAVVRRLQTMQRTMRVIAADQPPFHGAWGYCSCVACQSDGAR